MVSFIQAIQHKIARLPSQQTGGAKQGLTIWFQAALTQMPGQFSGDERTNVCKSVHFQSLSFNKCNQLSQTIPHFHVEQTNCYMNERQSRDLTRNATNAGPMRTNCRGLGGDMTAKER